MSLPAISTPSSERPADRYVRLLRERNDPPPWEPKDRPPLEPHQVPPDELASSASLWLLEGGRGSGKALALDTLLPTPGGWTTIGDVDVGDELFAEDGSPCRVLATFDRFAHRAWRLHFSDGTWIDACEDHRWTTWAQPARKAYRRAAESCGATDWPADWPTWRSRAGRGPQTITTAALVSTLRHGKRGDLNHCIPLAMPLALPPADLPIDPYVLGLWLGDGSSRHAAMTLSDADAEQIVPLIVAAGHRVKGAHYEDRAPRWAIDPHESRYGNGLYRRLANLGLVCNKHVPAIYLRAAAAQRLALLQGLMDSDGHADASNGVEFANTSECLAHAVAELARTLGEKPTISRGRAMLNGRDCGPKWRVAWRPTRSAPFRLPRKAQRIRPLGGQALRMRHRMIVAAEPIEPQAMRCLAVDAPNRLFLAGAGMIPTHNTEACARYFASYMRANPGHRGRIIAPTFGDAVEACVEGPSGLRSVDPEIRWLPSAPGGAKVVWPTGSEALVLGTPFPRDVDRLRAGGNRHIDWWEEMAANAQLGKAWDQAQLGLRLGTHPHSIASTTPRTIEDYKRVRAQDGVVMTHATLFDNPHNPSEWVDRMRARYEGTRLGRQELEGELISDVEGALWTRRILDASRVSDDEVPELSRLVVAVDPAATSSVDADDTGIIVAGLGVDGDAYVLADRTCHLAPEGWAQRVVRAFHAFDADLVVAETNNGGEMVELVVRTADKGVPVKSVTASRGKQTRAEPVAALFGAPPKRPPRVHMVGGFAQLEDQLCTWVPGESDSPDRLDALVWAITELMLEAQGSWRPL